MTMNKTFLSLLFSIILLSCSKSNINDSSCKFLLNVGVNTTINMSLPQYSNLLFPSNSVYEQNVGNGGIIIINSGSGFLAWDASDPNHTQSSCSILTANGFIATCNCEDENAYSLADGQPMNNSNLRCGLKNYRVEQSGNSLLIFN